MDVLWAKVSQPRANPLIMLCDFDANLSQISGAWLIVYLVGVLVPTIAKEFFLFKLSEFPLTNRTSGKSFNSLRFSGKFSEVKGID